MQVVHITYTPNTHTHTHTHMHLLLAFIHHTTISLGPQGPPLSSGAIAGVVLGGLVFLIVLAGIAVCVGVLVYGYRHPTSKIGLFMIEVCLYMMCCVSEQDVKRVRFANSYVCHFPMITWDSSTPFLVWAAVSSLARWRLKSFMYSHAMNHMILPYYTNNY